jgi:CubicO group peptidase (beta-lactamase class C family)
MLTGTGILHLVGKGFIRLDDKITQYVDPILKRMKVANPAQGLICFINVFTMYET